MVRWQHLPVNGGKLVIITLFHISIWRCTRIRETWRATGMRAGDEKYRYELAGGESAVSVHCWHPMARSDLAGKVLYARITSDVPAVIDGLYVERASTIATADTWIAARVADDNTGNHAVWVNKGPVVLEEVGVYTPDDWEHCKSLWTGGVLTSPLWLPPAAATSATPQPPVLVP